MSHSVTKLTASRWITICTVETNVYLRIGNQGFPHCLRIRWRGRANWHHPDEYLNWRVLTIAVRRRLHGARLEVVALACGVPPLGFVGEHVLICLVKRKRDPGVASIMVGDDVRRL